MTAKIEKMFWLAWLIILPVTIVTIYFAFPPLIHHEWLDIFSLGMMMIVMSFFYFQVRGTDIIVLHGISLAVFLLFGLFVEMILMQIATMTYLLSKRLRKEDWYRIPVNSLMFLLVSVSSGIFYYLINGKFGTLAVNEYPHLLPIIGYSFMIFLTNQLFLYGFKKSLGKPTRFFDRGMLWEAITITVIMPVGLVLYIMYSELGTIAIWFIAVPAISLSVIFRLVNSSYHTNVLLQKTNDIGQQLTENLDVDSIIDLFFKQVGKMLDPDFAYILNNDAEGRLKVSKLYEKEPGSIYQNKALSSESVSWRVGRQGKSFRAGNRHEWRHLAKGFLPVTAQSIISVPMKRNNRVIGVITVVSITKRAYQSKHQMMLEILANFLAVAIENAKDYMKTKDQSERDPLTNLFNYRHFTHLLDMEFSRHTPFSIIMLDLDHFKQVNDTYGHESGNKILCQIARLLDQVVGEEGIVARYGGEEFILLLHEKNESEAFKIAERIRMTISANGFLVDQFKGDLHHEKMIRITASIGVATAPTQGEDAMSLIRNADRAMYSGAKQKGRNRVAAYK